MVIDREALFERVMACWPVTIDLIGAPDAMNDIYWANESAYPVDDDWQQVAMWAFHQALAELAKKVTRAGSVTVDSRTVAFADFDRWMRRNLHGHGCWLSERLAWEVASLRSAAAATRERRPPGASVMPGPAANDA